MTSLTADLFLKRRLLKMAKSPVLSTGANDNSTSRYGNDLKFVMAFLDRYLFAVANGFSFNPIRSRLFQIANDPGWGFFTPPLRSRKLLCQSSPYHTCAFYQVF